MDEPPYTGPTYYEFERFQLLFSMSIKADSNMKQLFSRPLPFESTIEGEVNGERFVLHGSGVGDTRNGTINGKWVCTSGKVSSKFTLRIN